MLKPMPNGKLSKKNVKIGMKKTTESELSGVHPLHK